MSVAGRIALIRERLAGAVATRDRREIVYWREWLGYLPFGVYHWIAVDPSDEQYFHANVEPLLDHPLVEYVGELDDAQKDDFIGNAAALLFPIDWPEPFGLAMIEALACGTPVIAWPHGSVREVLRDGVSGWIVADVAAAVRAVGRIDRIDRRRCRAEFETRFTAERMANEYRVIFERAIARRGARGAGPSDRCIA